MSEVFSWRDMEKIYQKLEEITKEEIVQVLFPATPVVLFMRYSSLYGPIVFVALNKDDKQLLVSVTENKEILRTINTDPKYTSQKKSIDCYTLHEDTSCLEDLRFENFKQLREVVLEFWKSS